MNCQVFGRKRSLHKLWFSSSQQLPAGTTDSNRRHTSQGPGTWAEIPTRDLPKLEAARAILLCR
jgi:hypothetical protein